MGRHANPPEKKAIQGRDKAKTCAKNCLTQRETITACERKYDADNRKYMTGSCAVLIEGTALFVQRPNNASSFSRVGGPAH